MLRFFYHTDFPLPQAEPANTFRFHAIIDCLKSEYIFIKCGRGAYVDPRYTTPAPHKMANKPKILKFSPIFELNKANCLWRLGPITISSTLTKTSRPPIKVTVVGYDDFPENIKNKAPTINLLVISTE